MLEGKKLCVLAVDDDPEFLQSLAAVLEVDFEVVSASSPTKAFELVKHHAFDVIISDWQMPEMDGVTFVRRLLSTGCTASCLILTGRANELLNQMGFAKMGSVSTMQKSSAPELLIDKIKTIGRFARSRQSLAAMKKNTVNDALAQRRKAAERAVIVEEALSALRHDLRNQHGTIHNAVFFLQRKISGSAVAAAEPKIERFLGLILTALEKAELALTDTTNEGSEYHRVLVPTDIRECLHAIMTLSERPDVTLNAEPAELRLDSGEMAAAIETIFEHAQGRGVAIRGRHQGEDYLLSFTFASDPNDAHLHLKTVGRIAAKNHGFLDTTTDPVHTVVSLRLPLVAPESS